MQPDGLKNGPRRAVALLVPDSEQSLSWNLSDPTVQSKAEEMLIIILSSTLLAKNVLYIPIT